MAQTKSFAIDGTNIAVETRGTGPAILFLHGWPLHRATWRDIVPLLEDRFTCVLPDLPGLGDTALPDTSTTSAAPVGFRALAKTMSALADRLNLTRYAIVAHDTGGTVARLLAAEHKERVSSLLLMNTEIPAHRPPYIPFYQKLMQLPLAIPTLRTLLKSKTYLRSNAAFGGCFFDAHRLDDTFIDLFITPLIRDDRRARDAVRYLVAADFDTVDRLPEIHRAITAPVHLLWGADDATFPLEHAKPMVAQFKDAKLTPVEKAKLFFHEEHPERVAQAIGSLPA